MIASTKMLGNCFSICGIRWIRASIRTPVAFNYIKIHTLVIYISIRHFLLRSITMLRELKNKHSLIENRGKNFVIPRQLTESGVWFEHRTKIIVLFRWILKSLPVVVQKKFQPDQSHHSNDCLSGTVRLRRRWPFEWHYSSWSPVCLRS